MVLSRLAGATRTGGLLQVSLKEGEGARWSTHGHVDGPRHFTFWREEPLRAALDAAGWSVSVTPRGARTACAGDAWLEILAERRRETHRVLGPARRRARAGVLALVGGSVRDHRARRPTAEEALAAGTPPKQVWAAVWRALELPPASARPLDRGVSLVESNTRSY